ncbi:TonB-dependent receptor [uncultured Ferrimonas sp.]|uniref:TonB-dependent receptor plug domain-containing protein n=1 Tax=uncultured Ferrimonas sp. TaxID=432640 RepID=UPI00261808FC|nr:TonB-dependent receptor [uncultured Ferrimonas sp.]
MMLYNAVSRSVKSALILAVLAPVSAHAAENQAIERIEVTGSRIKQVDLESANPLLVISAEQIAANGFDSVFEALDSLSQNAVGNFNQQQATSTTPAASSINLRGAGPGRTLTLINGKRVAKYPFGINGTDNFVDVSNLPMAAIERIEVLTSGASAVYGSDAIGGVVNIIMKEQVDDTTINARYSDTDAGGLATSQLSMVTGWSSDKGHLTLFAEYEDREALYGHQRSKWGSDVSPNGENGGYSSFTRSIMTLNNQGQTVGVLRQLSEQQCNEPGMIWNSNYSYCYFDRASQRSLMPEQQRLAAMVRADYELNDGHRLYANASVADSSTKSELESYASSDIVFEVSGNDVLLYSPGGSATVVNGTQQFNGDFADAADGYYKINRRFTEMGPRITETDSTGVAVDGGIEGRLNERFEYDLNLGYNQQRLKQAQRGNPTDAALLAYLAAGNSIMTTLSAEDAAALDYTAITRGESSLVDFSAGISGDLLTLAHGELGFAAGVEASREWFSQDVDQGVVNDEVLGRSSDVGSNGERNQYGAYVEFALPLHDDLLLTTAGRYDRYDDVSSVAGRFTKQAALEYRPIDGLLLRGFWGETFRAPDMLQLFGNTTTLYGSYEGVESVKLLNGGNANLKEESGDNWNLGVVYDINNWHLQLDYWAMNLDDVIASPSPDFILRNEDQLPGRVERDDQGKLVQISTQAINMAKQESQGIDFAVSYLLGTNGMGELKLGAAGTYLTRWQEQIERDGAVEDYLDLELMPTWRGNASIGWQLDNYSLHTLVQYIGSHNGRNSQGVDADAPKRVDAHTEVNISGGYQYQDWRFSAGVNNVFDSEPELDPTQSRNAYYSTFLFDVVGREFYASAQYRF